MNNGVMPSDLSVALVINAGSVSRLHERIKELQQEKSAQKQLYRQARQQHVQLQHDLREMEAKSQGPFVFPESGCMEECGELVKSVCCLYICV